MNYFRRRAFRKLRCRIALRGWLMARADLWVARNAKIERYVSATLKRYIKAGRRLDRVKQMYDLNLKQVEEVASLHRLGFL